MLADLHALLGADGVSVDAADLQAYGRDWTRVAVPAPCAVAWPRSTQQVAAVVDVCRRHGVAIVPSGGRTGLAGGAIATKQELVLSLQRMRAIGEVDTIGQTVRVQAGAVTQDVHDAAREHGLTWPIDLAAKGSSTIGGNLATNAGGVKVIRYGHARQWVLGLTVVLADGQVVQAGGALEKDNSGLDLRQLFVGSEGTLGIITEATLKLTRLPGRLAVLLLGIADLDAALALLTAVRKLPIRVQAFEFFTQFCLEQVCRHRKVAPPLRQASPAYALLEVEATDALEAALAQWAQAGLIDDGVLAQSPAEARALWGYREGITESLNALHGAPHKNDVALPVAALPAFVADLERTWLTARTPADGKPWQLALFGHVGDGNLHLNTLRPPELPQAEFLQAAADADHALFELVQRHGGSISAEHGIGLVKKPYLHYTRGPAELAVLRAVKLALDPDNLLNPGKIFDL